MEDATTHVAGVPAPAGPTAEQRRVPDWLLVAAGVAWRALVLLVVVLVVGYVLGVLYLVTLPLAVAVTICTLTVPPTRRLQARGMPPAGATFVVVVGGLVVVSGGLALLAPTFAEQLRELGPTLGAARDDLFRALEESSLNLSQERLQALLDDLGSGGASGGLLNRVVSGATLVVEVLAGLALTIVLVFFFTKDGEEIVDWFLARTPPDRRDMMRGVGARAWTALSGYVRGTAIIALIDAAAIGVGLAVIGVPLVLPIALLVFLGAFLPVIGAFLSGSVGVLVALADGGLQKAALALLVVLAVQQVEGNVLQPMIMRRSVALHPVVILAALTAGAAIAGIAGAFLSVPVAAVLAAVGNEIRLRLEGDPDGPGSAVPVDATRAPAFEGG